MNLVDKKKINRSLSAKLVDARVAHTFNYYKDVLVTSSFGTTSAVLLHIVSRVKPGYPIYFIDTGYHFKETILYKERLTRLLGLNVVDIKPERDGHNLTQKRQMWASDPDRCCEINKVKPLEKVKMDYKIWMSGLIGFQNAHRRHLDIIEQKNSLLKCYPLIDWNKSLVDEYMEVHGLPRHPLEKRGFSSIGCSHCTVQAEGRGGRWADTNKTECGLHW